MSTTAGTTSAAAEATVAPSGSRAQLVRGEERTGWWFSTPALVLLLAFVVLPFAMAFAFSLTNQRLISPLATRFVGIDNYVTVLTDPVFWKAFWNNVWFVVLVVPLQTAFALWLAILVNRSIPGKTIFRTIFFMPVVTVMAAAAVVWTLLYNPQGIINAVMEVVTFGAFAPDWLNSTTWALPAIVVVSIWQGVGFQMIILLAALQDVPSVLYEASAVDGASRWQQFRNVTLPGIRNGLIFVVTVTTILAFRLFDQVWIMPQTPGGPLDSTRTMMLHMVDVGFSSQLIGRASAVAVVFFVIVLVLTLLQRRFIREEGEVQ
jgi:multiple sugar transport system permease protein